MRAVTKIRARKPSALAGDVPRAFLACGFLAALCVSAVAIARGSGASPSQTARAGATGDAELKTGSILLVSPTGNLCRERIIDNATGRIWNNGWVDCDEALAKAANSTAGNRSGGSRLDLIREGFRGRS
jgi:hypothetical protein